MPGFATGLTGDGFAGGRGFDATGFAGVGLADTCFAGAGFGDFTGPFLMAATDTSVINTATAVKTAYAIVLI